MDITEALYSYMVTHPLITAVIDDRIRPMKLADKDVLPAMSYQLIGDSEGRLLKGNDGLYRANIQLNIWADSYKEARDVSHVLRNVLRADIESLGDYKTSLRILGMRDRHDPKNNVNGRILEIEIKYMEGN